MSLKGSVGALESAAEELTERLRAWRQKALTPAEAAAETGYTVDHIRRFVRDGDLPNVGTDSRYLVRRCDLPREPCRGRGDGSDVGFRERVMRTVVNS